eukprot:Gb_04921 [translate_table: standard]
MEISTDIIGFELSILLGNSVAQCLESAWSLQRNNNIPLCILMSKEQEIDLRHESRLPIMTLELVVGCSYALLLPYWPTIGKDAYAIAKTWVGGLAHIDMSIPSTAGHAHILTTTNYLTKWVEVAPTRRVDAKTTVKFIISNIVCRFGVPLELVLNEGTHLWNEVVPVTRLLVNRQRMCIPFLGRELHYNQQLGNLRGMPSLPWTHKVVEDDLRVMPEEWKRFVAKVDGHHSPTFKCLQVPRLVDIAEMPIIYMDYPTSIEILRRFEKGNLHIGEKKMTINERTMQRYWGFRTMERLGTLGSRCNGRHWSPDWRLAKFSTKRNASTTFFKQYCFTQMHALNNGIDQETSLPDYVKDQWKEVDWEDAAHGILDMKNIALQQNYGAYANVVSIREFNIQKPLFLLTQQWAWLRHLIQVRQEDPNVPIPDYSSRGVKFLSINILALELGTMAKKKFSQPPMTSLAAEYGSLVMPETKKPIPKKSVVVSEARRRQRQQTHGQSNTSAPTSASSTSQPNTRSTHLPRMLTLLISTSSIDTQVTSIAINLVPVTSLTTEPSTTSMTTTSPIGALALLAMRVPEDKGLANFKEGAMQVGIDLTRVALSQLVSLRKVEDEK